MDQQTIHPLKQPAPSCRHQALVMVQLAAKALRHEHGLGKIRNDLSRIQGELRTAAALPSFCDPVGTRKH